MRQRAFLVGAHQAAVTGDMRRQYSASDWASNVTPGNGNGDALAFLIGLAAPDRHQLPVSFSSISATSKATSSERRNAPAKEAEEAEWEYIPYPASWLNAGGYDDEPEGCDEPGPVARDPRTFADADWQKRLKYFQEKDAWVAAWGPKPGEPGCLVPPHLILAPVSASTGAT